MGRLFKGKRFRFMRWDERGGLEKQWFERTIGMTAKVVCKVCNEGWMSSLETKHAKPAMAELIVGDERQVLSQSRANAIALFAFKTAVVVDHVRAETPFFSRDVRHEFARSRTIPSNVQMWLAGFLPMASGRVQTQYSDTSILGKGRIRLYVCTYAVGHLVFQVVAAKSRGIPSFQPRVTFEDLAIPFCPVIPENAPWPPINVLHNRDDFEKFAERWRTIQLVE